MQAASDLALCELLDWDSRFFDVRIASVLEHRLRQESVVAILDWCRQQGVDCLYFLADSNDRVTTRLAEDYGFELVDVRVELGCRMRDMQRDQASTSRALVRLSEPRDIPALRDIARVSYQHSRFYFDSRFARDLCDELYSTWIENSCEGYADAVLVAEMDGIPIGYVTCHLDDGGKGRIGLVGVDVRAQGFGVGQGLINRSLSWFIQHNVEMVSVVTQGRNLSAQRLYQRCGFLTGSVQLWYHKWFG